LKEVIQTENNTNKFFRVSDVVDAVEGTNWYHIAPDGHLTSGANGKTDAPLYKAADIQETLSLVPAIDLTEARMQTMQGFFEEVNLVLTTELHKAFQHSYIAENEYIQRETRRALSSIMSALGQIEGKYIDGDIAIVDLALENATLKAENEKLTKENENLKVLTEMDNEAYQGMRSLYHEDTDALMASINARNKEIEELEEKLRLYKEVCGELLIKDHRAVGVLRGEETAYIPEKLAKVYKGMAVNIAKRTTAKKILTDKVLIDHLERACGAGGKLALARIEELKEEHEVKK
jgi:hypothetical protein